MIRRPPRSTHCISSAASDVYKRQVHGVITATVLAIKYNDDLYYDNAYYAHVGGIAWEELNALEAEMFSLLGYQLYVSDDLFKKLVTCLETYGEEKGSREEWGYSLVEDLGVFSKHAVV
eukprot:TRINITY_DN1450_c0_g3_i2.p1 TRINITY_DN1450_c0_g3~~TRINITY_DN1450_c0_g3_i2.p1  ORF type:complete len:126 (+),score=45.04 TRINITY_DN1450_c0_g3_i2:22-378(+)